MISKSLDVLAVSMLLAGACSGADMESPDQTDQVQQKSMNTGGFTNPNGYTPDYTGAVINAAGDPSQPGTPIRGIHYVPGHYVGVRYAQPRWYVMDGANDNAAVIDSITYGGQTVASLTSNSGWFYVTLSGQTTATAAYAQILSMHVGLPFNGTIQIGPSSDTSGNAGKRYVANFQPDGSGGQVFWMNPDLKPDTSLGCLVYHVCAGPHNSFLVPIPGTKWDLTTGATTADANAVTFASGADSVGGCVGWGYLPWLTTQVCGSSGFCATVSLAPYHQACSRMKRADFCGDGRAWTVGEADPFNVLIQAWDNVGVHGMTPQTFSTMEAAWSPMGATCVNMSQLRTLSRTMSDGSHTFNAASSCSSPIPACTDSATLYTGSARPCTQTDSSGNCIAN
jgi:hypothetical protein